MDTNAEMAVVGVDLGGTKILAGVVNADGKLTSLAKRATAPMEGVAAVIERVAKDVRRAVRDSGLELSDISAVGLGAPGPLDPDRGVVLSAPNLSGWENIPLAQLLSEALGVPVFIENDVNLGTLGESVMGAARSAADVIGIFVGTGIGGGIVLGGELRQGWRHTAGEIGHMVLMADGPVCGCGRRGCAEALASRTAIERDIMAGIRAGRRSSIQEIISRQGKDRLTSGAIAEAFESGDLLVREVLGRAQFYLGLLTAAVVNFLDPELIVLGGGVVEAMGDAFLDPIREVAYQYFINQRAARDVRIVPAALGDQAVLLGASVYARRRLESGQIVQSSDHQ